MLKRLFDLAVSSIGIAVTVPLWMVIGVVIWLNDGGPVFFVQERVGKNGKIFHGYKFRTMIWSPEDPTHVSQAEENDKRITRVGAILRAAALDELPQLISILNGDMSFVGPRAIAPFEKEVGAMTAISVFDIEGFDARSKVVPGLTGIAQIFAPRDISRRLKFRYDIWYINNRTFYLDIYLIFLSFMVSFSGKWESRRDKFYRLGAGLRARIRRDLLIQDGAG